MKKGTMSLHCFGKCLIQIYTTIQFNNQLPCFGPFSPERPSFLMTKEMTIEKVSWLVMCVLWLLLRIQCIGSMIECHCEINDVVFMLGKFRLDLKELSVQNVLRVRYAQINIEARLWNRKSAFISLFFIHYFRCLSYTNKISYDL